MIGIWSSIKQIRAYLMPSFNIKRATLFWTHSQTNPNKEPLKKQIALWKKIRLVCHIRMKGCTYLLYD